ncbi:hypothetical protein RFI_30207 [Reticulomyxa filosa]|uniref:Uncharacterized protein n=1 Tax=Reticulomyxa filosa TaxID=46433 RepID=X6M2H8_RETFI|nr:hypothetical protein RFI_30207 [Reticulomyxa filosa]|eukprot:ETO07185.1 hypothetical protein RFI_30207 [Reticulomyxa filosa]
MWNPSVKKTLTKVGYKTKKIPFIPMSRLKEENLTKISECMLLVERIFSQIEKDTITIATLTDALEKIVSQPKRPTKKPFRMSVSAIYNIKGVAPCQMLKIKLKIGKATNSAKVEGATFIEASN